MANNDENPLHRQIMDLFEAGGATEDEDDDIFEPATDQSITTSMLDEDDEDEYEDAEDGLGEVEIVLEQDGEDDEDEEEDDEEEGGQTETEEAPAAGRRVQQVTLAQLQQLLASRGRLQQLLADGRYRIISYANADDDDDDDDYTPYGGRRRRRPANRPLDPNRFPPVPNENGRVLMNSGVYGTKDSHCERLCRRKTTVSERLLWRRLGYDVRSSALRHNRLIAQEMVPRTGLADKIIHYDSRAYSGQYSDDGNFFFSCTQNFKVQMYDTSNPYEWKYYKTVDFPFGQWTITDATLSPDNKFLAYSSIRHTVCLASTDPDDRNDHTLLDFNNYAPGAIMDDARTGYMGRQGFGIWSLRFSGDGREIVAGTSDHNVLVYDLETRRTTLKLRKHGDDVNAVCFGDKSSPHILFSGSDDQTLRVWDRRSMADGREAGVFVGHTEGLTYVDSKGDGRYVLSNGKDQMMKLWDLRKMVAPSKFDSMDLSRYTTNFDYRFSPYDEQDWIPNPNDCSVVTFRGHRVLKTLIRCHFSPPTSSNSRYVYSGSEDGKVYIWNMDATKKAEIDVGQATRDTRPRSSENGNDWDWDMGYNNNIWKTCVRDASWSPTVPVIAATSWNGWGMSTGTVSMHSWNDGAVDDDGDPPMGSTYDAKLVPRDKPQVRRHWLRSAAGGRAGRAVRSGAVGRAAANDDDEQEGW